MLLYDTLYVISAYSPRKLVFKGGTMISRVYLKDQFRFSWDLDFQSRELNSLSDVLDLLQEINRKLREEGATVDLEIGPHKTTLGVFELDEEKYIPGRVPGLIPVRRIMPALLMGSELQVYLRKSGFDPQDPDVTSSLIEMRRSLGQILRVEEVRAGIEIGEQAPTHERLASVRSLMEPEKKPLNPVKDRPVSSVEDVLADKVDSISKPPVPERMVDMTKDIFDAYHLLKIGHNLETVNERLEAFVARRGDVDSVRKLYEKAAENIQRTRTQTTPIFIEHHLFHPAQEGWSWEELCLSTRRELLKYAQISPARPH